MSHAPPSFAARTAYVLPALTASGSSWHPPTPTTRSPLPDPNTLATYCTSEAFEACTAQAHEGPQKCSPKLWRVALCTVVHADAEQSNNPLMKPCLLYTSPSPRD
eukprot:12524000-Alexandrium_andersonii.AAC.2